MAREKIAGRNRLRLPGRRDTDDRLIGGRMLKLKLNRPLSVFDIESTGANPRSDRIIDLAIVKVMPDGKRTTHTFRVNPGQPIPKEVTAIHGISDADVANCPPFIKIAQQVADILEGCDLCGYNLGRFDIPMLAEEFLRARIKCNLDNRRVIDPQRVYHKREPRDLTAALAFYCGEMHIGAHGAEADALATIRVLEGQYEKYHDLPADIDELHNYCNQRDPSWVDQMGRLRWANGEIVLNFGRKKDTPLKTIIETDPSFIKWILKGDFPRDMQEIISKAAEGEWPKPPTTTGN
jgi:DNA polymerase-3 subunit epsilon